jgi:hypothetical protein
MLWSLVNKIPPQVREDYNGIIGVHGVWLSYPNIAVLQTTGKGKQHLCHIWLGAQGTRPEYLAHMLLILFLRNCGVSM